MARSQVGKTEDQTDKRKLSLGRRPMGNLEHDRWALELQWRKCATVRTEHRASLSFDHIHHEMHPLGRDYGSVQGVGETSGNFSLALAILPPNLIEVLVNVRRETLPSRSDGAATTSYRHCFQVSETKLTHPKLAMRAGLIQHLGGDGCGLWA